MRIMLEGDGPVHPEHFDPLLLQIFAEHQAEVRGLHGGLCRDRGEAAARGERPDTMEAPLAMGPDGAPPPRVPAAASPAPPAAEKLHGEPRQWPQ